MGKPTKKPSEKQPEKLAIKPKIKTIAGLVCAFCPFCEQLFYEGKPGKKAADEEGACLTAFRRHAPKCEFNPDYKESETTKFIKKIRGDTE